MKTCGSCGLGIPDNNDFINCFKYKTLSNSQADKTSCICYIKILLEDGEPIPPVQHLFLVEEEFRQHKMKISINHGLRL